MVPAWPPAPAVGVPGTHVQTPPQDPRTLGAPSKLLNTREIFAYENYPYWAREGWEEGTVRVRVELSASGAVTSCQVTRSSGSAALDVGTCNIITARGRFAPARDEKGKAVPTSHVTEVTWRLVQDELWKVEDSPGRVVYSVGPNLVVSGCRIEGDVGDDPRTCGELRVDAETIVASSPPGFDWKNWDVVVEMSDFAGPGDLATTIGKRQGERLFDREIRRRTIGPEGRIKQCETIEASKIPATDNSVSCEKSIQSSYFEPVTDDVDRILTSVTALYLRKKK